MSKNRKFTEGEKLIYALGFRDGESQLQQTINAVKAANAQLMEELLRLDFSKPILGDPRHVIISHRITILKKIIKALQGKVPQTTRYYYARRLQKHIDKHEEQQRIITAKIEKGLMQQDSVNPTPNLSR